MASTISTTKSWRISRPAKSPRGRGGTATSIRTAARATTSTPSRGATKWGDELRALQAEHAAGGGLESFAEDDEEACEEYEEPAAAAPGAIGSGLERHVDPTSRASYYFDPASGVTQWGDELRAMRADFTGMVLDDFAEGEEEEEEDYSEAAGGGEEQPTLLTDPASGYQYYYDRATGETRWVDES